MNLTTRVPIGPVGIITPWNTPSCPVDWKIAPAPLPPRCTSSSCKPADSRR
uniref:aldehyde dehydrogenase family protein n=1 Tax=Rhizobium sp. F40D2 TaxID=3453141 RepID=UPI003F268B2E